MSFRVVPEGLHGLNHPPRHWGELWHITAIILICQLLSLDLAAAGRTFESFAWTREEKPERLAWMAYDIGIFEPGATIDFTQAKRAHRHTLAYISGGDLAKTRDKVIAALAKGFDGCVLEYSESDNKEEVETLLKGLRHQYESAILWMKAPVAWASALANTVDGWLFTAQESSNGELGARVADLRVQGLTAYAIDYAAATNEAEARTKAEKLRAAGAVPFITTPDAMGCFLAPRRQIPRRILVLFGDGEDPEAQKYEFEMDTVAALRLQMPLEWMGYTVDFRHIGEGLPPNPLPGRYAGVILDGSSHIPYRDETAWIDWLLRSIHEGRKILLLGDIPFHQELECARFVRELGLKGDGKTLSKPYDCRFASLDKGMVGFESEPRIDAARLLDLQAANSAQSHVGIDCKDDHGYPAHCDAIITAPWGGIWLDPFIQSQASTNQVRMVSDPFALLDQIWPAGAFPAPDPTTLDGLRTFYSQIDGDGFSTLAHFGDGRICGEVMLSEILSHYKLPITCSVIEAEMRGLVDTQKKTDAPRCEKAARELFVLNHVQAGSHSYSHPFIWFKEDTKYLTQYETCRLPIRGEDPMTWPDCEREIAGSVRYIEDTLLPSGKKVEMMLWSGNCRPSPEAIDICERLGLGNMNGGDTIISRSHPSVANVSPRIIRWKKRRQFACSAQNEFIYTREWSGPFYAGFRRVLETYEMTEKPRRLTPVDVYFHFYSAAYPSSLKSLKDILNWCVSHDLHPVTAREYVDTARDADEAAIFSPGTGDFLLVSSGKIRTWRWPIQSGVPNEIDSEGGGFVGWNHSEKQCYAHAAGTPVLHLRLAHDEPAVPRLESSNANLQWRDLKPDHVSFKARCWIPLKVRIAGLPKLSRWQMTLENGRDQELVATEEGRLEISGDDSADFQAVNLQRKEP